MHHHHHLTQVHAHASRAPYTTAEGMEQEYHPPPPLLISLLLSSSHCRRGSKNGWKYWKKNSCSHKKKEKERERE